MGVRERELYEHCRSVAAKRTAAAESAAEQQATAAQQASITEATVEALVDITEKNVVTALNSICSTEDEDACPIEDLLAYMSLPDVPAVHEAMAIVLDRMESANMVMYREGIIHLI